MKNERTREWVEALRSGKYTQGMGYLAHATSTDVLEDTERTTNDVRDVDPRYCCLGVGAELARVSAVTLYTTGRREYRDTPPEDDKVVEKYLKYGEGEVVGSVPREFAEWLGFTEVATLDVHLGVDFYEGWLDLRGDLAELNDDGLTFDQIADLIAFFGVRLWVS